MDKIKPCPFCGGEAFVATVEHPPENGPNGYRFHGQIMCRNCQASAGTTGFDLTHEEATRKAIAAWNRRADHLPDATKMVSNADRIRSMSDEELADSRVGELVGIAPCSLWVAIDAPDKLVLSKKKAVQMELAWLQQPAEEEV